MKLPNHSLVVNSEDAFRLSGPCAIPPPPPQLQSPHHSVVSRIACAQKLLCTGDLLQNGSPESTKLSATSERSMQSHLIIPEMLL